MEWVEMTGQSIEEAKEAALDELGVDEQDADIEVLADVKMGLFGRVRNPARVRARIRPTTPRAKEDRRDRRRRNRSSGAAEASSGGGRTRTGSRTAGSRDRATTGESGGSAGSGGSGRNGTREAAGLSAAPADGSGSTPEDTDGEVRPSGRGSSSKRRSRHRGRSRRPSHATADAAAEVPSAPADTQTDDAAAPPAAAAERPSGPRRTRPSPATPLERHVDLDDNEDLREGADMEVALDEQAGVATEFLSGLVDRFGLQATLEVQQPDDETLSIELTGDNLGLLIGPKGATLLALQDLTRTVVQRRTGAGNGRIYVDVSGYRRQRSEALARFAAKVASDVQARGQRIALEPMSAPDRKVVHDALTDIAGIHTVSEGEEPHRRVVVIPDEA